MKKKDVIDLIKYHVDNNEEGFRNTATSITRDLYNSGDKELAQYLLGILSNQNVFTTQELEMNYRFLKKNNLKSDDIALPDAIMDDIKGIINAINYNVGVNKFIFEGHSGTGKTESVKQIAKLLNRTLLSVNFNEIIDYRLGATSKNISETFSEINNLEMPKKFIILFDEIDALALDRINSNDVREMGRVTSSLLKELDNLNEEIVIFATTNLYSNLDEALVRRFNKVINFDRYSKDDILEISENILNEQLKKFPNQRKNMKLLKKILCENKAIIYPGDLKNLIISSLAFSNKNSEYAYLRNIYISLFGKKSMNFKSLYKKGYTLREIEIITEVSKSKVDREIKESK